MVTQHPHHSMAAGKAGAMAEETSCRKDMQPVTSSAEFRRRVLRVVGPIIAVALFVLVCFHSTSAKSVVLLGDETASKRHKAEDIMQKALHMASTPHTESPKP
eukprot:2339597-Rhodomonas_salina.1